MAAVRIGQPAAVPPMVVSGVYTDADGQPRLLGAPDWTALTVDDSVGGSQLLDLRSGLLLRRGRHLRTLRFVSAARLDAMALRAEGRASTLGHPAALAPADSSTPIEVFTAPNIQAARTRSSAGGGITVAVHDHENVVGKLRVIERLATVAADQRNVPGLGPGHRATRRPRRGRLRSPARRPPRGVGAALGNRPTSTSRGARATNWRRASPCFTCWDRRSARTKRRSGHAASPVRPTAGTCSGTPMCSFSRRLAAIHPAAARAMLEYRDPSSPGGTAGGTGRRARRRPLPLGVRRNRSTMSPRVR